MAEYGSVSHSTQSATLSPMGISLLGLEQAGLLHAHRGSRPGDAREDRRVTSYYNQFLSRQAVCDDAPPSYRTACRDAQFARSQRHLDNGREVLPKYTCTVFKEGPMQLMLESMSPFANIPMQEWRPVYVCVQGTALYIYKLKTTTLGKQQFHGPGKHLRTYTLQHAEIGLAPDVQHTTVHPSSRLASLIPPMARKRAYEKDPSLFRAERQFALRMRSELDQFILTNSAEEQIMSWINHISAGIDIAPALDERNAPRQVTMPRRRRRQPRALTISDMNDERFIDQQRRLLALYPSLSDTPPRSESTVPEPTPTEEEGEVDLAAIAEDPPTPPAIELVRTLSATASPFHAAPAATCFSPTGKWQPPHPRSLTQQWRYIRRCMPVLLPDTPRHSSVLIVDGTYVRPNFKTEALERFVVAPPAYDAHGFPARRGSVVSESRSEISRVDSSAGQEAVQSPENKGFVVEVRPVLVDAGVVMAF